MRPNSRGIKTLAVVAIALAGNAMGDGPNRSMDVAGVVIDEKGGKPLEGAWVLLSIHELRSSGLVASSHCIKTTGMYTGADGAFRFTVDPSVTIGAVTAIKPGYHSYKTDQPTRDQWNARDKRAFGSFLISLQEKDPIHPQWEANPDAYCDGAKASGDVAASDTYLKIQIEDEKKLSGNSKRVRALQDIMDRHASLDVKAK